jgi:hypothetical protein
LIREFYEEIGNKVSHVCRFQLYVQAGRGTVIWTNIEDRDAD